MIIIIIRPSLLLLFNLLVQCFTLFVLPGNCLPGVLQAVPLITHRWCSHGSQHTLQVLVKSGRFMFNFFNVFLVLLESRPSVNRPKLVLKSAPVMVILNLIFSYSKFIFSQFLLIYVFIYVAILLNRNQALPWCNRTFPHLLFINLFIYSCRYCWLVSVIMFIDCCCYTLGRKCLSSPASKVVSPHLNCVPKID